MHQNGIVALKKLSKIKTKLMWWGKRKNFVFKKVSLLFTKLNAPWTMSDLCIRPIKGSTKKMIQKTQPNAPPLLSNFNRIIIDPQTLCPIDSSSQIIHACREKHFFKNMISDDFSIEIKIPNHWADWLLNSPDVLFLIPNISCVRVEYCIEIRDRSNQFHHLWFANIL